jgi:ATPase subunit of ABC transporter with duplicated ATPase domains
MALDTAAPAASGGRPAAALRSHSIQDAAAEMAADPTLLSVESVAAGYERPVVGPISFSVARGEIVCIRGPNGSGKSTLMKAIGGTVKVFAGRIEKRRGLRIAHQQQNPLPLEDIPLSGRELLALTGADSDSLPNWIRQLLDRRLDRLSGGQLQFLQVWACLKAPVDLVMLDEPTNNVDPKGLEYMEHELVKLTDGHAIILISHDHRFLDKVCTRLVEVGK